MLSRDNKHILFKLFLGDHGEQEATEVLPEELYVVVHILDIDLRDDQGTLQNEIYTFPLNCLFFNFSSVQELQTGLLHAVLTVLKHYHAAILQIEVSFYIIVVYHLTCPVSFYDCSNMKYVIIRQSTSFLAYKQMYMR